MNTNGTTTNSSSNQIAEWTRIWAERTGLLAWYLTETESTNVMAKNELGADDRSAHSPVLYVAAHQTAGRGRGGNTWTNTDGALLSSWSFHMPRPPQPIFSPLAGLAVYRAAAHVWPDLPWSLKAPNDLYIGPRKVAGLLIETVERGHERRTIIGLGMNILSAPRSVETATSVADEFGGSHLITEAHWNRFLKTLMENFTRSLVLGQESHLSPTDAHALRDALNRRPNIDARVEKVGLRGELHTEDGIIDWHQL
jgi:BirA family biotin operon repressor/biotin-[acetyl-CoA-carboxylase] ligase